MSLTILLRPAAVTFSKLSSHSAYAVGLFCVVVWGVTFVNTKVLLLAGLSPSDVLFYRTLIAWSALIVLLPKPFFSKSWKDEGLMVLLGMLGGSLYFLTENTALAYTQASNVAVLVTTSPLLTVLVGMVIRRDFRVPGRFWLGSLLALTGVVCVIMNGVFILKISPKGDLLTLAAALCWALYSLLLKVMMQRYNARFLTRKVLFYALLTLTPYFTLQPLNTNFDLIISWQVLPHLLYLGLVAQTICFILWNVTVDRIGAMRATNLLYLSPVITMLAAVAVLNERITWVAIAGCALILAGVALSDSGLRLKK